jgi:hypothetical protein
MAYVPVRRGFTGPSAKIGGSASDHIDFKLLESLPIAERVKAVDALAKQYRSIGREIEFSNTAVSGRRWDPGKDLSDKVDLLNQAAAAHSHSRHPGWQSLDFYVPFRGKSRFEKGAVEDASIFLPAIPGGKVRSNVGSGYGYYSEALDPGGRVVFRIGHGNIDRPEKESELAIAPSGPLSAPPPAPVLPPPSGQGQQQQQTQDTRTADLLEAFMYGTQYKEKDKEEKPTLANQLLAGALSQALSPQKTFISRYIQGEPYIQGQAASTYNYLQGLL